MQNCLFCKIIAKEIPAKIIYEDESVLAFNDIRPQAPHHVLIIPKKHVPTLNDFKIEDAALVSHIFFTAQKIAKELGISDSGYRVNMNCNAHGGQEVYHVHWHLLGGRQMHWPPG